MHKFYTKEKRDLVKEITVLLVSHHEMLTVGKSFHNYLLAEGANQAPSGHFAFLPPVDLHTSFNYNEKQVHVFVFIFYMFEFCIIIVHNERAECTPLRGHMAAF